MGVCEVVREIVRQCVREVLEDEEIAFDGCGGNSGVWTFMPKIDCEKLSTLDCLQQVMLNLPQQRIVV